MSGLAPLGYNTIQSWANLTGNNPAPYEIDALIMLDAAMMTPDDDAKPEEDEPPVATPAWPKKKTNG